MYYTFLSAAFAFLITFFSIPIIIQIAKEKKLYDEPDERKVHNEQIASLGGIGIFSGFIVAMMMGTPVVHDSGLQYFVASFLILFFLGLKDDIMVLGAGKKAVVQMATALILVQFGGVEIQNLHGFLGIHEIPKTASIIFSVFTIMVITNSFNLIDGIDGLAGTLSLLTTLIFGTYFLINGHYTYSVMSFSLAGALIAFLIYNFNPAKIFMGDTGSLLLGVVNAVLVIKFINLAGVSGTPEFLNSAPAVGFAVLIVPLLDTLRVFALRILDRRSPFSPDRLHIHHILLDAGFNHKKITFVLGATTVFFTILAYTLRNLNVNLIIAGLIGTAFLFVLAAHIAKNKAKQRKLRETLADEQETIEAKHILHKTNVKIISEKAAV